MKRILAVLSEHGYWGEELVGPMETLTSAGYDFTFVTPTGRRPRPLPPSMDPYFVDPPLDRTVTTADMARKVRELDATTMLDCPVNLSEWFPERPYLSASNYLREVECYYQKLESRYQELDQYAALLLVGGSGPIVDMVNNQRLHDLILGFWKLGKPIAAECYGVACLAFARDPQDRRSLLQGKHVTGHCLEYDYKDGTGFLGTDFNMGPPPYPLEYILRDATAPGGAYIGNVGRVTSCVVDYPFITSRSTPDSYLCAEKLLDVLEHGLMRFGW
jgi:putative intracellular protease/amidase